MKLRKPVHASLAACSLILLAPVALAQGLSLQELPKKMGVAIQGRAPAAIHAATEKGLYVSRDQGKTWTISYPYRLPATTVASTPDGAIYAFMAGKGLLRIQGEERMWTPISNKLGAQVLTHLSGSATNPGQLAGLNQFGRIIVSNDGGANWQRLPSDYKPLTEAGKRGKKIFTQRCQSCHGVDGVGETFTTQALTDKNYISAPALDDSAHAWHHTDDALVKTILDGSPRTEKMRAWKKEGVTEEDARDLVAYIKSLWGQRALDCQGPKHMQCGK
ncbi:c-type cytochrome [Thiolapillus brandeum]|uniref:Cytochrome c domain-containing protein n=1 Tax=Thiolapillus brandeum TaxID=1076588 RepID=A0A7U6GIR7_9GAMM|nr:cytochrome c [Thiolapillus brandeum]BAO44381.1 hypothetical protein TBH_C1458 [Thiolapillus brandeum]